MRNIRKDKNLGIILDILKKANKPVSLLGIYKTALELGYSDEDFGYKGKTPDKTIYRRLSAYIKDNPDGIFKIVQKKPLLITYNSPNAPRRHLGRFIAVDGIDGAGKTTQVDKIVAYLQEKGITVYRTREIGGTEIGERIREMILNPNYKLTNDTELLLILAARKQHIEQEILPRLEKGEWVITDRFNDATYAYQGYGRGIPVERIEKLEKQILGNFAPDISFILSVYPELALERVRNRNSQNYGYGYNDNNQNQENRFEQQGLDFYAKVRFGFKQRAKLANHELIDAYADAESVFNEIKIYLDRLM